MKNISSVAKLKLNLYFLIKKDNWSKKTKVVVLLPKLAKTRECLTIKISNNLAKDNQNSYCLDKQTKNISSYQI